MGDGAKTSAIVLKWPETAKEPKGYNFPMPYHFYLARCSNDSLYAGWCKDIAQREAAHNTGKGAKYTRAHRPVKIIYSESFETQAEAMRREAHVKTWSKRKKEELVESNNVPKD